MGPHDGGKIINISSGTALKGAAGRIHYVTSKAGILGFTRTLAMEVGKDNICVNCVAPGSTLSEENPDEALVKYRQAAASGRRSWSTAARACTDGAGSAGKMVTVTN